MVVADLLGGAAVEGELLVGVQRSAVFVRVDDAGVLRADHRVRRQAAVLEVGVLRGLVGAGGEVGRIGIAATAQGWCAADAGQQIDRTQIGAVRCRQARTLVEVQGAVSGPAVAFQFTLAEGDGGALFVAAAFFLRLHRLGGQRHAFERCLGDEVDHAADGIRAVDRGCAIAQDFDARQGAERNHVQVGVAVGDGLVGQAAAVQQHQGAIHAQAAQIDIGAGAGIRRRERCRLRQRHHHVGQCGHAGLGQVFGLQDADRQRRFRSQPLDAGAGHFDAGHAGVVLGGSLASQRHHRHGDGRQQQTWLFFPARGGRLPHGWFALVHACLLLFLNKVMRRAEACAGRVWSTSRTPCR